MFHKIGVVQFVDILTESAFLPDALTRTCENMIYFAWDRFLKEIMRLLFYFFRQNTFR